MSNIDGPAEDTGGAVSEAVHSVLGELPKKLRVHALAKLLDVSSKDILAALTDLGEVVRSPQSSVSRETAERIASLLRPADTPVQPVRPAAQEPAGSGLAPVFTPPSVVFLPPQPAPKATEKLARDSVAPVADVEAPTQEEQVDEVAKRDGGKDDSKSRRRRRGRRGRGRGRGGADDEPGAEELTTEAEADVSTDEGDASQAPAVDEVDDADIAETGEGNRRRRRRRRRKNGADDDAVVDTDDPPNTVVHVRESREDVDLAAANQNEVRSVRGSTRLEAKRQRRRDGREAGRRRAPILTEAEFLARREAVDRKMVVRERGERTQIAVLEDGILVEHFITAAGTGSLVGNVYLGKVQNVLPSMEAAFVDIGRGRNAVLYAGEVDWDAAGLEGKARKIEQALSTGDNVLVQVTKDPVGHKGARLTTQISLAGRFLVYVPGGGATGISRKLPDNERKRLKEILKRVVPDDAGVIIRTASEGVAEEELARDVRRLQAQWDVIKGKFDSANNAPKSAAPQLLYEEPDLLIKVIRDLFTEDFSALIVEGGDAWETINGYVNHVAPDLADRLQKYVGTSDAFNEYRVDEQIAKALDRKVWLPSGGYLVIDRTEAMTVIDVNTGKFTGSGGNLEETVTRNNLESAEEIVRQLRLRDIGGIIVIDFIDMVLESNRDLVLRRLTECLSRDRTKHQVAEVTSLGLVQLTRKKIGTGLLEAFSTPCEHCRGRGLIVSTEPVYAHTTPASVSNGHDTGRKRQRGKRDNEELAGELAPVPAVVEELSVAEPLVEEPAVEPTPAPEEVAPEAIEPVAEEQQSAPEMAAPEVPASSNGHPVAAVAAVRRPRRVASRPAGPPTGVQVQG